MALKSSFMSRNAPNIRRTPNFDIQHEVSLKCTPLLPIPNNKESVQVSISFSLLLEKQHLGYNL